MLISVDISHRILRIFFDGIFHSRLIAVLN